MEAIDRLNRDDYYMRNMLFLDEIDANLVPLVPSVAPIADPGKAGAISVTQSGVCLLTSGSSAETRTLAVPTRLGMTLDLVHSVDGVALSPSQWPLPSIRLATTLSPFRMPVTFCALCLSGWARITAGNSSSMMAQPSPQCKEVIE